MVENAIDFVFWLRAIEDALQENRSALNLADAARPRHGDEMVEAFYAARSAASDALGASLPDDMDAAGKALLALPENVSAQIYGRGLQVVSAQFRRRGVTYPDLLAYARRSLQESPAEPAAETTEPAPVDRSKEVFKALVNGLSDWKQTEQALANGLLPEAGPPAGMGLGALFDFGVAYVQARARGGSRLEVIADAAATISPLSEPEVCRQSAKIALLALLSAVVQTSLAAEG